VNAATTADDPLAERVANWLALIALVALGVVWPGSEARQPPRSGPSMLACAAETPPSPPDR
jgi:hypothetical protein